MAEKLIFVKELALNLFRFDFSEDAETAWGENWNIVPSAHAPNIEPDKNCVSSSYWVDTLCDTWFEPASISTCFSMQDCIDGIIPLAFTPKEYLYDDSNVEFMLFPFGMDFDEVMGILKRNKMEVTPLKIDNGEDLINNLIDDLNENSDE